MIRHIQNPTSATSRAALDCLRATINRISKRHIGFNNLDAFQYPLESRAERASTVGVMERLEAHRDPAITATPKLKNKTLICGAKRRQIEQAKRAVRADNIRTDHLKYHGNGVWSTETRHPDAA